MPTPTRSWRPSTGRMSALAAASINDVVGYALRNSAPSILRMRAMASTTLTLGAPLASRLREEDRDLSCGLRLVFLVGRIRHHGELPQSRPLGLVGDLADPHRLDRGVVAELDGSVRSQVVHPDRICRRPSKRPDEDVVGAVLDAHQRSLANRARLVAGMRHEDHGQPGLAERGALPPTAPPVEVDLPVHPLPGAGDVATHGDLLSRPGHVKDASAVT